MIFLFFAWVNMDLGDSLGNIYRQSHIFSQNHLLVSYNKYGYSCCSFERQWDEMYHYGWDDAKMFRDWIKETKDSIRIYLILGDSDTHLGLLVSSIDL